MLNLNAAYNARIDAGKLRPDQSQRKAIAALQQLAQNLENYYPRTTGLISRLFPTPDPKGLYIYGDVGRGKSVLMDLFFSAIEIPHKRRVHFHHFMLEIHDRLHRLQKAELPDIIGSVAKEIAKETWLLAFDEFHVENIADAMILGRLFEALFKAGVVVVSTSNWPPTELYKNGLQRDRFLPFIDLLLAHMEVHHLDGAIDHRYQQISAMPCYFHPLSVANTNRLKDYFVTLSDNAEPTLMTLPVQGRLLRLTHAANGVGFFNFKELCVDALGPADYLEIAACLHTILLDDVPQMSDARRNETTRFINLIDVLYEAKVQLYMVTDKPLEELAPPGALNFAFQRTQSRLTEMQSETYRQQPHKPQ